MSRSGIDKETFWLIDALRCVENGINEMKAEGFTDDPLEHMLAIAKVVSALGRYSGALTEVGAYYRKVRAEEDEQGGAHVR